MSFETMRFIHGFCGLGMMVFHVSSASFVWELKAESLPPSVAVDEFMTSPALVGRAAHAHRPYPLQWGCLIGLVCLIHTIYMV